MVYVFLADGFEEIEALATVDILRRSKIEVLTVSVSEKTVKGAHGINIEADITKEEFDINKPFDCVMLPGGMPGTKNLDKSPLVKEILNKSAEENKFIAAICAAPLILGKMGILRGKNAVCYPGFESNLLGANIVNEPSVRDGFILTGKGPGAVFDFAFALCDMIKGESKTSSKLKKEMQCDR